MVVIRLASRRGISRAQASQNCGKSSSSRSPRLNLMLIFGLMRFAEIRTNRRSIALPIAEAQTAAAALPSNLGAQSRRHGRSQEVDGFHSGWSTPAGGVARDSTHAAERRSLGRPVRFGRRYTWPSHRARSGEADLVAEVGRENETAHHGCVDGQRCRQPALHQVAKNLYTSLGPARGSADQLPPESTD